MTMNRAADNFLPGVALKPQTVNNTTVSGETISEPWTRARGISFTPLAATLPATTSLRIFVQGQKRSDGAWENLKEASGDSDLEFTPTVLDVSTDISNNGFTHGSLDLTRLDSTTYKAIRLRCQNEVATAAVVAIAFFLYDLYEKPAGASEQLYLRHRNG